MVKGGEQDVTSVGQKITKGIIVLHPRTLIAIRCV
jgi:hypothetical protein